jgi:uncharacterized lipoprotein YajG
VVTGKFGHDDMKILIVLALVLLTGCAGQPGAFGFKVEVSVPTGQGKVDLSGVTGGTTNTVATH